jgi:hypothetical protein
LTLPGWNEKDQAVQIAAVRRWLRQQPGWLLVFDKATKPAAVDAYLPQSTTGQVVITSRNPNRQEVALCFSVEVLPRDKAIELLLKLSGQSDEVAGRLAELLGYLPLALAQAGAYVQATRRSLAWYFELLQTRSSELLDRGTASTDYRWTVATTWQLAFLQVQEASAVAADLLNLCAFLAPENITRTLLSGGAEHVPQPLAAALADALAFNDAVMPLLQYSLLAATETALSVHRLVQAVTRDGLQEEARRTWATAAVQLVNNAFPNDSNDVLTWPTCAALLPHALVTTGHAEAVQVADEATSRLLNQVGLYLLAQAQFGEAQT